MKKLFSLLLLIALLVMGSNSFASVGVRLNGSMIGTATDINVGCGSGTNTSLTADGSIYNINCSPNLNESGFANAGYVSLSSTSNTISPSYSYVQKVLDTNIDSFQTGTLANGYPGQMLTIVAIGYSPNSAGTNAAYTLSFTTSLTLSSIKFTKIGDIVTLVYLDDTNGWYMQSNTNVGITVNYHG